MFLVSLGYFISNFYIFSFCSVDVHDFSLVNQFQDNAYEFYIGTFFSFIYSLHPLMLAFLGFKILLTI
jgi:hypothetical protein